MMNIYDVNKKLKQRPPFQMIEKVLEIEPGVSAVGTKAVSANDPWFVGHFPDQPIMPGVLIIETCAQLCSICMMPDGDIKDDPNLYVLLKVDQFKFLKSVIPGDLMRVEISLKSKGGTLVSFQAVVTVDGEVRAKGSMTFTAVMPEVIENIGKQEE